MSIHSSDFQTGGALQSGVAASLLRHHRADSEPRAGEQIGSYRIQSELGRGGMAIVYLAERSDGEYDQQVAVKWMLDYQTDETSELLFRRERQALADLNHPHIARLLDGGRTAEGRLWFVMELIDGEPIDAHCINRSLPTRKRLELFVQVCSAVAFAHASGFLHSDIKPSNVLVDSSGSVRLLDFGITQWLGEEDRLATRAFTPGYASPEQMRAERLTVHSDIYQLGCLLKAILGASNIGDPQTTISGSAQPFARNAQAAIRLPADLAAIIAKATAAAGQARYPTADALADDIRAFIERRPVLARPRRATYLLVRAVQRHPFGFSAAIVALLTLILGTAWFTYRLGLERDSADYQARVANSVLNFLREDLLASASPAAAPGQELSVREALDLASTAADTRFAEAPIELGAIRTTLAGLYDQLGRYDEAEREARAAVALARHADARSEARQVAGVALVDVLLSRGQLDEAEIQLNDLISAQAGSDEPNPQSATVLSLLQSRLANLRGQFDVALALAQSVLTGPDQSSIRSDTRLWAAEEAATNLQMLGRHEDALPLLSDIHARRERNLGPEHPSTLLAVHELGLLMRHQGRYTEAEIWMQKALAGRRKVLGQIHPDTLSSTNELATVLQELKRYGEAEILFRQVLELRLDLLGEEHQFTRNSMSNLGLLYSVSGRLDEAAPLYERALAIEIRLIGDLHPDTIALMHNIAGLYRKQGKLEAALAIHDRAISNAVQTMGADAWQTALFRAGRGLTLQAAGRLVEAEAELVGAIEVLKQSLGPDHPRTLRAMQMRAIVQEQRSSADKPLLAPKHR